MPSDTEKPDQTFEQMTDEWILRLMGCDMTDEQVAIYREDYLFQEAKAAITRKYHAELERIIGKDEYPDEATEYWQPATIKNKLRAEQRERAGIEDKTSEEAKTL